MTHQEIIPIERIRNAILIIRGHKVILDRDLARLYGVPTKALKQAVKRHAERFPDDFMFVLDGNEVATLRSQFVTSNSDDSQFKIVFDALRQLMTPPAVSPKQIGFHVREESTPHYGYRPL